MIRRTVIYWQAWRGRGAARLDHWLWLHWTVFGRFPSAKEPK